MLNADRIVRDTVASFDSEEAAIMRQIMSEVLLERLADLEAELSEGFPVEKDLAFVRHLLQLREQSPASPYPSYQYEPKPLLQKRAIH